MSQPYVLVIVGLAAAWFLQLFLTYRQLRLFYARYNELRRDGPTAIATEGSIYKGRLFALLVADGDNSQVVHAEQLSGWTVFARLRPVESLVGLDLATVAGDQALRGVSPKARKAFRRAAADLLKAGGNEGTSGEALE
jgi:DNA-binding transcriptional regulator of glucitol operon